MENEESTADCTVNQAEGGCGTWRTQAAKQQADMLEASLRHGARDPEEEENLGQKKSEANS